MYLSTVVDKYFSAIGTSESGVIQGKLNVETSSSNSYSPLFVAGIGQSIVLSVTELLAGPSTSYGELKPVPLAGFTVTNAFIQSAVTNGGVFVSTDECGASCIDATSGSFSDPQILYWNTVCAGTYGVLCAYQFDGNVQSGTEAISMANFNNGVATVDQSLNGGISVTVNDPNEGDSSSITVTSQNYGGVSPSGTGILSIGENNVVYGFYDVQVTGDSNGETTICFNIPYDSGVTDIYVDGLTGWGPAQSVTITGNIICGEDSTSYFSGTPVALVASSVPIPTPEFPFGVVFGLIVPLIAMIFYVVVMRSSLLRRPHEVKNNTRFIQCSQK